MINFIPEQNQENIITIFGNTLKSYKNKKDMPLDKWVENELKKYPEFQNNAKEEAKEIVKYSTLYTDTREKIEKRVKNGDKVEYATLNILKNGLNFEDTNRFNNYIKDIDKELEKANQLKLQTYLTQSGEINKNPQLHGFIAEEHHTNTFNIEAALKGSKYRAEMLQSNDKNSVDIVIKDTTTGKIVRKYSSKYGQSAEETAKYFKKGDYRGQRKLVPSEQKDKISNSSDVIESPDGLKSRPLTRAEAKRIQKEIQERKKLENYEWEKLETHKIAKYTAMQTVKTVLISSLLNAAVLLGQRAYETVIKGKKYSTEDFKNDLKIWFNSSKVTATTIGIKTAINTAFVIVVRKGLIPILAKSTPVATLTAIVHVGMENAKTLYKMAKGEIGFREGLKEMKITTSSTIAGLALGAEGAAIGSAIGTIFGPVGTAVGSFIGGVVGSMAGKEIVEKVVEGAKNVYNKAKEIVSEAYESIKETAVATIDNVSNAVSNLVSSASEVVSGLVESVGNAVSNAVDAVKSFFS